MRLIVHLWSAWKHGIHFSKPAKFSHDEFGGGLVVSYPALRIWAFFLKQVLGMGSGELGLLCSGMHRSPQFSKERSENLGWNFGFPPGVALRIGLLMARFVDAIRELLRECPRIPRVAPGIDFSLQDMSGKEETHKHKQICRIVPGLCGWQNLFMHFLGSFLLVGRQTHKQNPPQNPGTIPWRFCLCVFFAPENWVGWFPGFWYVVLQVKHAAVRGPHLASSKCEPSIV